MARRRSVHRCAECGAASPQWVGRCPGCDQWNTLVEEPVEAAAPDRVDGAGSRTESMPPLPLAEVPVDEWDTVPTGVAELDRVLGGGLVPGSVTVMGGEPGVGKSTLLLQVAGQSGGAGRRVVYLAAEEARAQVRRRAERLSVGDTGVWLGADADLPSVVRALDDVGPDLFIVDSVQSVFDPQLTSAPGSVAQVRAVARRLVDEAKERGVAVVLVGHVTKEGALAGPRVLEHMVDTVLSFEGDRHHALRLLRAIKHRFGSTRELGVFEMSDKGLLGVPDPSGLFLSGRRPGVSGSVVVPSMEGDRPLLVEVQALVTPTSLGTARRSAQGVDGGRLSLLLAVLETRARLKVADKDVYSLAVGGVRLNEPGADLALALAVASSAADRAVPADTVVIGEVGLGGEVRQVSRLDRRLAEAARLGFKRAILPPESPPPPSGLRAREVGTVGEAVEILDLDEPAPSVAPPAALQPVV